MKKYLSLLLLLAVGCATRAPEPDRVTFVIENRYEEPLYAVWDGDYPVFTPTLTLGPKETRRMTVKREDLPATVRLILTPKGGK